MFVEKHVRVGKGLLVNQLRQFEQERLAGQVVQPVDDHQVIGAATIRPEGPMIQRCLLQLGQLIAEVLRQHLHDPRVAGCAMVLLQHLQHDHPRPPVLARRLLHTRFRCRFTAEQLGPQVARRLLVCQRPFDPRLRLGNKCFILEDVGQRYEPIDPIRSTFPTVTIATQPAITRSTILG